MYKTTPAALTHSVWIARSEVKVPLARVWILLSYSDSRERFCRSWKALARTQWILLAFSNLKAWTNTWKEEGRKSGSTCQSFFMCSFIIHSSRETKHRYKVYFKVTTPSVSGSKICRRGIQDCVCLCWISCACGRVCSAYSSCRA